MAMTKAERAELDAWRVRAALTWAGEPPKPIGLDVWFAANPDAKAFEGWTYNAYSKRVEFGWSKGNGHGSGSYANKVAAGIGASASQGPGGPWFHTKREAMMAMRHAVAMRFAGELAAIDLWIEGEV